MILTKKIWRKNWLQAINELTSSELQRNSWLDYENAHPHWSFVEFMCCYFDDVFIDNDFHHLIEEEWVSMEVFEKTKEWHILLSDYKPPNDNHYDDEAILDDKEWAEIMNAGFSAKERLSKLLEKEEREILLRKIDHRKEKFWPVTVG